MKLAQAILLIPPGVHLRCGLENCDDEVMDPRSAPPSAVFGTACLMTEPPEGGWTDRIHSSSKFEDRATVSISCDATDHEAFERLTVHMIVKQYGTAAQLKEARATLDRHASRRR